MVTFLTYFAASMGVGSGVVITVMALRFLPQSPHVKNTNEKSLDALITRNDISAQQLEVINRIAEAIKYAAHEKD